MLARAEAVIDAVAPLVQGLTGARMERQLQDAWLTVAPISTARISPAMCKTCANSLVVWWL